MNPQEASQLIDHAASQTDRWLFIALLVIFLISIAWLLRYGMKQLEKRDEKIDALQKEMGEVRKEQATAAREQAMMMLASAEKFATIIANNTAALDHTSDIFGRLKGHLEVIAPVPPLK